MLILSFILASLLYLIRFLIRYKVNNKNKLTAFERGFRVVGRLHSRFSIHFFVILLMFVIFDLEIVLLLGCLLATNSLTFFIIMVLVIGRVYLESYLGKLKWIV